MKLIFWMLSLLLICFLSTIKFCVPIKFRVYTVVVRVIEKKGKYQNIPPKAPPRPSPENDAMQSAQLQIGIFIYQRSNVTDQA